MIGLLLAAAAVTRISLAEAESRALQASAPVMAEAIAGAAEARAGVGTAWGIDDPTLSVGTSIPHKSAQLSVGAGVSLPLFGQSIPEIRAAREEARAAESRVDQARLDARAAADRAWLSLWKAEALALLARESLEDATRVRDAAKERFDEGDAPRKDLIAAQADLARATADVAGADAERLGASAELAVLVDAPATGELATDGAMADPAAAPLPDAATLTQAIGDAPEAIADEHRVAAARAHLSALRLSWLPRVGLDFTVNQRDPGFSGTDEIAAATIAIPIGGKHGPSVRAAGAAARRERASADLAGNRRRASALVALHRAEGARARLAALDGDAVPASRTAYEMAEEAYRSGEIGVFDVVTARRSLAAVRAERVEAFADAAGAIIDLARITGRKTP